MFVVSIKVMWSVQSCVCHGLSCLRSLASNFKNLIKMFKNICDICLPNFKLKKITHLLCNKLSFMHIMFECWRGGGKKKEKEEEANI